MKLSMILIFLLVVISKANDLNCSTKNQSVSIFEYEIDTIRKDIADLLGPTGRKRRTPGLIVNVCRILNGYYRSAKLKFPDLLVLNLFTGFGNILDNCSARDFQVEEFFSQPYVLPGTNWCGPETIAKSYHDLGYFTATDTCCRAHDYCDDVIRPGRQKHNLYNPHLTTRLHCKCDEAFRKCLKKANTPLSNIVGYIFFNQFQTQCFDLKYPTSQCLVWKRGPFLLHCVKYKSQVGQSKMWQWFDKEPYV